jgi:ADP-ribose pyrophosphatase YjhB (NUDIX family)
VVSAQNCWPDPVVAKAAGAGRAGAGRAVGLVMSKIGVATWSPGTVERGEMPEQAVLREAWEETGVEGLIIQEKLGVQDDLRKQLDQYHKQHQLRGRHNS